MSNEEQAQIDLFVNGRPAIQALDDVKKKIESLGAAIKQAEKDKDAVLGDKLKGQLQQARKELRYIESGAASVNTVLKQINKSTPDDLNRALKFLNREIKYIERGTPAWDEHVAKIKQVKGQLDKVNAELRASTSLMDRMKNTVNNWGMMLMGGTAGLFGLVSAGRKAVNAYASMDEQLANTRKYTGMTVEQVNELNEAFKKMSTRTSREELNLLAQEAGRLGKTTQEDVQGYVEAADIINVALVDLGEGATQTIAKMASIFRVDEEKGTRDAMLSVGSAVNVLSQNCTAGKQYLVDFTQRMAGVGSVSKMTIPEILAFGATLDANGQKCEMAASALGKLVMKLYQEPKEMARQVGLDVAKFEETLNRSTNEGVLMFLQRIKDLGSKDGLAVLAPMFKELGVDGVRMSQVMATLADKLEMVRWEQQEANKAFNEATSATNEYNIFNNTVQAGIDKARKRISELSIELGEKLLPVMGYFLSSTSMTMKALRIIVDWVIKYKGAIITLGAAVAAYTVVANLLIIKEKAHAALIAVKTAALHVHKVAVLLASAAYGNLTNNTIKANAAMKLLKTTMSASPWGLLFAGITAAVGALAVFVKKHNELNLTQKTMADAQKEINKQYVEQKSKIDLLNDTLHDEKLSLEARKKALDELKSIVPDYHASLTNEGKLINDNADAIDNYTKKLEKQIQMQVYQEKLMELYQKKMQAEENLENSEAALTKAQQEASEHSGEVQMRTSMGAAGPTGGYENSYSVNVRVKTENLEGAKKELSSIEDAITKIKGKIGDGGLLEAPTKTNTVTPESGAPTGGGETVDPKDRLKQLEDEKKKELAINQVAYLQGEKDFEAYTTAQIQAEVNFNRQKMSLYQKGSTEYLEAQAAMLAAEKKLQDQQTGQTVEAEQKRYADVKAVLDQRYADSELSAKAYQLATEQAELEHLKNLANTYEEGSKERLKAEERYQQRSTAIQQKHAADAKRIQEQLQKAFFDIKDLGVTDSEGYAEQLAQLDALYQHLRAKAEEGSAAQLEIDEAYHNARFELAKQYNDQIGMETEDSARATFEKMAGFLQTDGAKKFISAFSAITDAISNLFSGVTDLIEAEVSLQTAQIEKRYDAEIAAAGENKDLVEQLEQQKQDEISKVKTEAADKEFKMNIFSAIAQGALAAINAWNAGVGAGFPAGLVLGPMMLAMSLAATGIQIAAMKKQHDAAMAQGYAAGGYTAPGGKYQPAGIVHAGEWVASQELLANPTAAATIAQLDQAQRTNTIGQLSKPSPVLQSENSSFCDRKTPVFPSDGQNGSGIGESLDRLNRTLDNGIYAATTMTGDKGIQRQQRKYDQLMRNKGKK